MKLLYTDTDSLIVHVETADVYKDMEDMREHFDFSNFDPFNPWHDLYDPSKKRVVGLFKDKMGGKPIKEFVGLRSKVYSVDCGAKSTSALKGVMKAAQKRITQEHFKQSLLHTTLLHEPMHRIGQSCHRVKTIHTSKVALCPYDDKRYLVRKGSYAYGHCKISG